MDAPARGWRPANALFQPGKRLTLHLGVLDQPYATPGKQSRRVMTTYAVAKILERNYGVMQMFFDAKGQSVVAPAMEESFKGALEAFLMGHAIDPFGRSMQAIEHAFRQFISSQEIERQGFAPYARISGAAVRGRWRLPLIQIPTKAALRGVNHRLAHPYAKGNPRRPSFKDTGMFMNSFRAWAD